MQHVEHLLKSTIKSELKRSSQNDINVMSEKKQQ